MTMIMINIHEAKARLSHYLRAAARGERVLICNRNRPIAELRAVASARQKPRPVGDVASVSLPPSFFEPLPDEMVAAFYGQGPAEKKGERVAEPNAPVRGRRRGRKS